MIYRLYDVKGGTVEHYEAVMRRPGEDKPSGVHAHIMGVTDDGFKVIEIGTRSRTSSSTWTGTRPGDRGCDERYPRFRTVQFQFEVHRLDCARLYPQ